MVSQGGDNPAMNEGVVLVEGWPDFEGKLDVALVNKGGPDPELLDEIGLKTLLNPAPNERGELLQTTPGHLPLSAFLPRSRGRS